MPASLGELLSESIAALRSRAGAYALGVVVFALLCALVRGSFVQKTVLISPDFSGDAQEVFELGLEEKTEIDPNIDPFALQPQEEKALDVFKTFLPLFTLTFAAMGVIMMLSLVYFFLIATNDGKGPKNDDIMTALKAIPRWILPFFGLWIWIGIRSFVWIPILGFIIAIYMMPRLALSPAIMVKEGRGILESARASYQRTDGYWAKIFGNLLAVTLCIFVLTKLWTLVLSMSGVLALSVYLLLFLEALVPSLLTAFNTIFIVKLAETIAKHPRAAVS